MGGKKSIYDLIGLNPKTNEPLPAVNGSTSPSAVNLKVNSPNKTAADDKETPTSSENLVVESPSVRTDQIFQKMDLDRNGVISESEFINGCLQDKFLYQMLTADYSESFWCVFVFIF